jgi:hypothetical protein
MIGASLGLWRSRLRRWTASEGFCLLTFQAAHALEWPGNGWPSKYNTIFRVEARDSAGRLRTGWLRFGTFLLGAPLADEHWD